MGNNNPKVSSSTSNPKEENVVATPQPQSPLLIQEPRPLQPLQPQQPLQPDDFERPLLYPSYTREDYEKMRGEKIDLLFAIYGIMSVPGDLADKRKLAIETFRWDDHNNDQHKA